MGRMDLVQKPREFSLGNDQEAPTVLLWRMANPREWDAYERATHDVFWDGATRQINTSASRAMKAAKLTLDFCLSLVTGVRAFEVDDGSGGTKELTWPGDRDRIVALLTEQPAWVGVTDLFVRTVMALHRPATEADLAARNLGN